MHKVSVHELKLFAYHGLLPDEKKNGTYFLLDIDISIDLYHAASADNIHDTVNYAEVVELAKKEMNIRAKLLETVVLRIIKSIKALSADITNVNVRLKKLNPPIDAELGAVSVTMNG